MKAKLLSAAALGLLVAACGTNSNDRVGGGAAAGAATGATVGALGGPVGALGGAAIGAGAGAATGALTTPEQVNLGRPVWNDPEVRVGGRSPAGGSSASSSGSSSGSGMGAAGGGGNVREVQRALNNRGFNVSADGRMGPQTRNALMDFQRQNNIEATGRVDQRTASALGVSSSNMAQSGSRSGRSDRDGAYMGGGMVVDQNSSGSSGSSSGSMGSSGSNSNAGANTGAIGNRGPTTMDNSNNTGANPNRSSGVTSGGNPVTGRPLNAPVTDPAGGSALGSRTTVEQNPDVGGGGGSSR